MDVFNNKYLLNNKKCNIVLIWIMLLIIFFLIFLNIAINYRYKSYEESIGYVKKIDDSFNLVVYVLEEKVSEFYNYGLLVNSSEYDFSINSISDGYYIIEDKKYYEVVLNVELDERLLVENNIVNVIFEKNFTTLYKEFKKGLKKWLS